MATKPKLKVDDGGNRARLLNSAADTFAETGYEGTSLRLIADKADVAFQLISYYFGSKEDLWRAVVDDLFGRYVETGSLELDLSGDVREQFRDHLRFLLALTLERPQLLRIWVQEHLAGGERYERVIKPKMRFLHDELSLPYFTRIVELGIVKNFSPDEIANLWGSIVQHNVVYPYYVELLTGAPTGSAESIDGQVDLALRILTEDAGSAPRSGVDRPANPAAAAHGRAAHPAATAEDRRVADPGATAEDRRVAELEMENKQLRELVATLSLEKKLLADKLHGR